MPSCNCNQGDLSRLLSAVSHQVPPSLPPSEVRKCKGELMTIQKTLHAREHSDQISALGQRCSGSQIFRDNLLTWENMRSKHQNGSSQSHERGDVYGCVNIFIYIYLYLYLYLYVHIYYVLIDLYSLSFEGQFFWTQKA